MNNEIEDFFMFEKAREIEKEHHKSFVENYSPQESNRSVGVCLIQGVYLEKYDG